MDVFVKPFVGPALHACRRIVRTLNTFVTCFTKKEEKKVKGTYSIIDNAMYNLVPTN